MTFRTRAGFIKAHGLIQSRALIVWSLKGKCAGIAHPELRVFRVFLKAFPELEGSK